MQNSIACSGIFNVSTRARERPFRGYPASAASCVKFSRVLSCAKYKPLPKRQRGALLRLYGCGRSMDAFKKEKSDWYMSRSIPQDEPEQIPRLRKEEFKNGLNAGCFLFITPAVSQAAIGDGTMITTAADGHEIALGTLPTF